MVLLLTFLITNELREINYIDPLSRTPTHYQEYNLKRSKKPFNIKIIKSSETFDNELIAIIVNDSLYPKIENSINQYVQDLYNEGFAVEVITTLGGVPADIRNLLQSELPNGLIGVLLVGDLPIAWWEDGSYGEDYPIDFFFTDLDGDWIDSDNNGIYDQHSPGSGDLLPEIWVGRLYASRLTYDNEAGLINDYFSRNHQYRTGMLTLPNRGLVYNEVDWYPNDHGMGYLYNNVTVINDENTTTAYDYKSRLNQEFQFVHSIAHSSCWAHTFFLENDEYGGGSVFSFEIPFLDPNAFFYFLNACMAGRYTETNNLANWYLFSHSYSQVVIASSSVMYGINNLSDYYQALGNDSTFGDAFNKWFKSNYDWFRGTLILGDPSLKVLDYPLNSVNYEEPSYSGNASFDWTIYQVENSQFVNGNPTLGKYNDTLWIFWDSGRIVRSDTYCSFFTGSGFSPPESLAWHPYYDYYPSTTTDSDGRLWVAWQSFRDYSQYYDHFSIYSCYYLDGSWSAPQNVNPLGKWHDVQGALAAGSDGKVWVTFKSFRDGNANIYISNATSGGPWIDSYALTQTPEDETDPSIVIDRDNNVWVFWSNSNSGHYQIQGRTYNGVWHNVFLVDSSKCDNLNVQAAVDSLNRIWLVWNRWVNNQGDIFYSYYDGSKWLLPEPITSNPEDDILPSITIDGQGRPWICWMSDRDNNWNIYYSYYDGGWNSPGIVTTDTFCDIDPEIKGIDSSRTFITWTSNRNNYWNIYGAFTDITATQERYPSPYETPVVRALPNPFYRTVLFECNVPFKLRIYNTAGRLVEEFNNNKKEHLWKPKELAQGVYLAQIRTKFSKKYLKIIHIE